jgi:hypothetical protein
LRALESRVRLEEHNSNAAKSAHWLWTFEESKLAERRASRIPPHARRADVPAPTPER